MRDKSNSSNQESHLITASFEGNLYTGKLGEVVNHLTMAQAMHYSGSGCMIIDYD